MSCIACESFAAIAPRFSGGSSAISSALIIYIIHKSETRFRIIYHRIMLGMSLADIISSAAIGLSTLPMPIDLPYQTDYENAGIIPFIFKGTRIGNIATCEAQGFCYVFGFTTMFAYNAMLGLYNTCAIAFGMEEEKIRKRVEPFLHLFPLACGLGFAIPPLIFDLYNPTSWDAWCSLAIRGRTTVDSDRYQISFIYDIAITVLSLFLLLIFMIFFGLIIRRVIKLERALVNNFPQIQRQGRNIQRTVEDTHKNTKIVTGQALAYFVSFILTLGITLVRGIIEEPDWLIRLSFAMLPLQGFFNMLIFVFYKILNYRRKFPDVSRWNVLKKLLKGSAEDPVLFSRVSLLEYDQTYGGVRRLDIESERGGEFFVFEQGESGPATGGEAFQDDSIDMASKQDWSWVSNNDLSGFDNIDDIDLVSKQDLSRFDNVDESASRGDLNTSWGGLSGLYSTSSKMAPEEEESRASKEEGETEVQ